ncbi:transposase [Lipingzhangella halophila]|uniref:transposase n=1 Tax=Lipingzhangella halophila TaxID=1783352 RepID=UPI0016099837
MRDCGSTTTEGACSSCRKPYPPESRCRAVALARQGHKSTVALAKDLGTSRSCLQNWVAQAAAEEKPAGDATRPRARSSSRVA